MAPEFPPRIVVFDSMFEAGRLKGSVHYVEPKETNSRLRVRWSVGHQPKDFRPVVRGVAYIYDRDVEVVLISDDASPAFLSGDRYQWTEGLQSSEPWLMFVLILPSSYTLTDPRPMPAGTKVFEGRLALYWILKADDIGRTKVEWTIKELEGDIDSEIVRINKDYLSDKPPIPTTIRVDDKEGVTLEERFQKRVAYTSGVVFTIVILATAILFPTPTPFQYTVFRIVLALAAAGIAAMIPGFLSVEVGTAVRATGAIAVFVIIYFFSPAQLFVNAESNGATGVDQRRKDDKNTNQSVLENPSDGISQNNNRASLGATNQNSKRTGRVLTNRSSSGIEKAIRELYSPIPANANKKMPNR
jgi:hypothetical protein